MFLARLFSKKPILFILFLLTLFSKKWQRKLAFQKTTDPTTRH